MHDDDITAIEHTVDGRSQLTEGEVRAYLSAGGYAGEVEAVTADARRFPLTHTYTADRHRFVVFSMPGGYWLAGDCTRSEERIKALGRGRRAGLPLGAFTSEDGRFWR